MMTNKHMMAEALRGLEEDIRVLHGDDAWADLEKAWAGLPAGFTPEDARSLPAVYWPNPQPSSKVFATIAKILAGTAAADARAAKAVASGPRLAPNVGKKRPRTYKTVQMTTFQTAMDRWTEDEVVEELRQGKIKATTASSYSSATAQYENCCKRLGIPPWPICDRALEAYCGYLRKMHEVEEGRPYSDPTPYVHALIHTSRSLHGGSGVSAPVLDTCLRSLDRVALQEKQSWPITLSILREMAGAVRTPLDYHVFVATAAAFLLLCRIKCFTEVDEDQFEVTEGQRVAVTLKCLKGSSAKKELPLTYEAVSGEHLLTAFAFPNCRSRTPIPGCPVAILCEWRRLLREERTMAKNLIRSESALVNAMNVLLKAAGIETQTESKGSMGQTLYKNRYTGHCTRVGGVCCLLKAGMDRDALTVCMGNVSDQLPRYGFRVITEPSKFQPWAFYNPHAGFFNTLSSSSSSAPPAKRRK